MLTDGQLDSTSVQGHGRSGAVQLIPVATLSTAGEILSCDTAFEPSLAGTRDPTTDRELLGFRVVIGLKSGYVLFYVI